MKKAVGTVFCIDKTTGEEYRAVCYFPTLNDNKKEKEILLSKALTIKSYREALQNVGYVINEKTVEIDTNNYIALRQGLIVDATVLGIQAQQQLESIKTL